MSDTIYNMNKYLIHIGICGFGNQLLGFKEACIIAKYTNRTIIAPIFIPHGTIRSKCKNFYEFDEIFDFDYFANKVPCIKVHDLDITKNAINNIYNIRSNTEQELTQKYLNYQREYYGINFNANKKHISKQYILCNSDLDSIKNIEDNVLVLCGTFNNVILNKCYKNGCLNKLCSINECFINDYNYITNSLIFSKNIDTMSNNIIKKLLNNEKYAVFHLRTTDLTHNKNFITCYGHEEEVVYSNIVEYLKCNEINTKFIVIAPPDAYKIHDMKIFNSNKVFFNVTKEIGDLFYSSIVELDIALKCDKLICSSTNTPEIKKIHTRSSFTMHIKDIRKNDTVIIDDLNKKLFIYRITSRGLFSELNNLLIAIQYCQNNNYDIKIELDDRDGLNGKLYFQYGFDKYFKIDNIETYDKHYSYKTIHICGGFGKHTKDITLENFLKIRRLHLSFNNVVDLCKKLQYTDYILNKIKKNIEKINLPDEYVFFHIRRGDKLRNEAKKIDFEEFFKKHIDSRSSYIKNIFIASDDYSVIEEAEKYLIINNMLNYKLYHNTSNKSKGHNTHYNVIYKLYFDEDYFINLMTDIEIGKRSKIAYCTYTSNIGRYLAVSRGELKNIISLDIENWFSG